MTEDEMVVALQRGLPLSARPFEELACELGCAEGDLLACLARCREDGHVRRFGAVFDTRRLGYRSALCAVAVPSEELDAVAAKLTPLTGVTHCYLREPCPVNLQSSIFNSQSSDPTPQTPTPNPQPPVPNPQSPTSSPQSPVPNPQSPTSSPQPPVPNPQSPTPNLWFTLSYPADIFPAMADEVAARLAPHVLHVLPATRRYKVDVVFGAATRAREEGVLDDLPPPSGIDRALIGALQGDTEVRADYFTAIADRLGMKEWDVLSKLELWRRNGRLKRIGLLLHHRNAGWTANGMCCWKVEGDTTEVGRALAERGEVTHCYERPEAPNFPYNLFAMIHARSVDEAREQFATLSEEVGRVAAVDVPSVMLLSTREFKKTSMTFFASN